MKEPKNNPRHPLMYMSTLATNLIHRRNPWVTVWWSAAFPGFGQIIIGSYIKGFTLMAWELTVNVSSRLNVAIMYSFTGRFDQAREVLDPRWLILYVGVYVYGLWDSYRSTVDLNKFAVLAEREKSPVISYKMDSVEMNYLDKRSPWVAMIWSILMPGMGHLYTHRLPTGFIVLIWWIAITYFSRLLIAVHYSFLGQFQQATAVVDPLWLLFMPSLYLFAIYDSYSVTVEYNKLFALEQARFLEAHYQDADFPMPL